MSYMNIQYGLYSIYTTEEISLTVSMNTLPSRVDNKRLEMCLSPTCLATSVAVSRKTCNAFQICLVLKPNIIFCLWSALSPHSEKVASLIPRP